MKARRSGQSQGTWLHEISIHNEGSRTKKNESRPKTKDSKIWFQDPKSKPKPITKSQSQNSRNQDSRVKNHEFIPHHFPLLNILGPRVKNQEPTNQDSMVKNNGP